MCQAILELPINIRGRGFHKVPLYIYNILKYMFLNKMLQIPEKRTIPKNIHNNYTITSVDFRIFHSIQTYTAIILI